MSFREDCLEIAKEAVTGRGISDKQDEDTFPALARWFSVYFREIDYNPHERDLTPKEIIDLQIIFKVCRSIAGYNVKDTYIDIAGYASIGYETVKKDVKLCECCSRCYKNSKGILSCQSGNKHFMFSDLKDCKDFRDGD